VALLMISVWFKVATWRAYVGLLTEQICSIWFEKSDLSFFSVYTYSTFDR